MKNGKKAVGRLNTARHRVNQTLLKQARKEGNIVFGGRAIKRKLGINARPTKDWDFFSEMPKQSSSRAEMNLDRILKRDVFFNKKGKNPSTWKVKHVGRDLIPRTEDDIGIADFTRTPKPKPKTFTFRGVKYRSLEDELKAKKRLLKDKGFEFRRKKDLEDFIRIKKFGNLNKK